MKLLSNEELSKISQRIHNTLPQTESNSQENEEDILIGSSLHFGSRIQPNSPGDDPQEILFHTLEGIINGCGDVIIG